MAKKKRYIIIGCARSGTTITHLAIMGHPFVAAINDEVKIEPFFTKGISAFTFGNDQKEEKQKGYSALFNAITLIKSNDKTVAHGFKTVCNSYTAAKHFVRVLQNNLKDIKIIFLVRRDLVAQLGSALHAKKTGIMHSWYNGFENRKIKKLKINKWRFTSYAINIYKIYDVLKELEKTHDVLKINYEDLIANSSLFCNRLFNFLNLKTLEPKWIESKKVMPSPETYIKNYNKLTKILAKIESGTLSLRAIFYAKIIGHVYWILQSISPIRR